ncbi:MAG: ABC transporter ATP-binding protein [Nitriliruptoraceae bacterium]|nr:ABC transporter ATP-binding protein [Nitriliruptoraceae bacterium]
MTGRLELQDLTVRYGDTVAVDRVTATLEGGRIHGLLGRNGSGKTSLLSAVAAFRRPDGGQVLLDGEPVFENPAAVRRMCLIRGAGDTVVHDWPGDRVRHALDLAARLRPHWDRDHADRLVERFALRRTARLSELSRGQRSALGVVLGLASRAPVTILDESYIGLDAPSRYAFYDELLADHSAHPRTILLATHLIEEVAALFETVTIIDRGRLLLQGSADDLRARGAAVTGPAEAVADLTDGMRVLASKQLGPTRSDTVFGELTTEQITRARRAGLQLDPVPLQDLFVHLTDPATATEQPVSEGSLR